MLKIFNNTKLGDLGWAATGIITSDNDRFLRLWFEVSRKYLKTDATTLDDTRKDGNIWFPLTKGGGFRKWYGNNDYVIEWHDNGYHVIACAKEEKRHGQDYKDKYKFAQSLSWSHIYSGIPSFRYTTNSLAESKGPAYFAITGDLLEICGLLNSKITKVCFEIINPTLTATAGAVSQIPFLPCSNVKFLVSDCITISKQDWDAHETSWDFQRNGLLDIDADKAMSIVNDYSNISSVCIDMAAPEPTKLEWLISMNKMNWEAKFLRLHAYEEELNRQFIEIYGLQDELNPHVDYEDITILQQGEISLYRPTHGIEFYGSKEDAAKHGEVLEDEGIVIESQSRILWQDDVLIKQLISYMVGVWMGRYRLDRPGLNIAHPDPTEDEMASYQYGLDNATLVIDDDAIIPILPKDTPFEDNLSNYISDFVRIAWGEESQTDNLNFIEQCLGKKIEDYVQKDFWKDHKKMYQNRPIYWLFSSKKGAFKALVYVHRMHPYTVEQVRTRYLLKYMDWLRSEAQRLEIRDADLTTAERRRLDRLRSDIEECEEYHERLQVVAEQAIPIDLDNGIPANHALFGDILSKLK